MGRHERPVFDLGKMRVQEEQTQVDFKDEQSDGLFSMTAL